MIVNPVKQKKCRFLSLRYIWLVAVFVVVTILVSYYPQLFHKTMSNEIVSVDKSNTKIIKFNIEGMVCTGCEETINHSVKKIEGILQVNTSHKEGTSIIEFDTTKTNSNAIKEVILSRGYIIQKYKNE